LCDRWDGRVEPPGPRSARFGSVVKGGMDSQPLMWEGGQCNWKVLGCAVDKRRIVEVIITYERTNVQYSIADVKKGRTCSCQSKVDVKAGQGV